MCIRDSSDTLRNHYRASEYHHGQLVRAPYSNMRVSVRPFPTREAEKRSFEGISSVRVDFGAWYRCYAIICSGIQAIRRRTELISFWILHVFSSCLPPDISNRLHGSCGSGRLSGCDDSGASKAGPLLFYLHTQGGIVNFLNTLNIHSTDPCRSINCNYSRMGSFTRKMAAIRTHTSSQTSIQKDN